MNKLEKETLEGISLCKKCNCMTKKVCGKCYTEELKEKWNKEMREILKFSEGKFYEAVKWEDFINQLNNQLKEEK